jgi:uroporphyrin-III C-methyltransferase
MRDAGVTRSGLVPGRVVLIGAGPGAADLLTLRAAHALGEADVVLVDELVEREILRHCRSDARILGVGKRGGCRSTPQAFIERLMLRYARHGRVVARLKGGDSFVFGRGGEEAAFLRRHGVPFEVVPGLTAGIAVPAMLGIPVTHRGVARGVTFVTGHASDDGAEADWAALVRSKTTLVVYMGLQRIAHIASRLLAAGMEGATPAIAIAHGTRSTQRQVAAPLSAIAGAVRCASLPAPVLIVIGDVVGFAAEHMQQGAAAPSACRTRSSLEGTLR